MRQKVIVKGTERLVPFPLAEYEDRIKKIKKIMEREQIDLLYLTSPESQFYVSGFDSCWYRANSGKPWYNFSASGIALHIDHDDFIFYDNPAEEYLIQQESITPDVRIFGDDGRVMYGKVHRGVTKDKTYIDCVVEDLQAQGWTNCTVGLELGTHRPSALVTSRLQAKLEAAGCKIVDGTDVVREVRQIKSPLELECVLNAAVYTNKAIDAIIENIRPGMTELEVTAIYEHALRKAGSENMAIVNMCRTGEDRLFSFHSPAGRRVIQPGDPVGIDVSGVHHRYHANVCRIFAMGEDVNITGWRKDIYEGLRKSHGVKDLIASIIKPNMKVSELMDPVRDYFKELGIWGQQFWTGGYEIGLAYPPDWCGTLVYGPREFHHHADELEEARFVPGSVVNFEHGFGPIDTIVFTETEARIIGETSWDVIVIK